MKKILVLVIVLFTFFSLTSCGEKDANRDEALKAFGSAIVGTHNMEKGNVVFYSKDDNVTYKQSCIFDHKGGRIQSYHYFKEEDNPVSEYDLDFINDEELYRLYITSENNKSYCSYPKEYFEEAFKQGSACGLLFYSDSSYADDGEFQAIMYEKENYEIDKITKSGNLYTIYATYSREKYLSKYVISYTKDYVASYECTYPNYENDIDKFTISPECKFVKYDYKDYVLNSNVGYIQFGYGW